MSEQTTPVEPPLVVAVDGVCVCHLMQEIDAGNMYGRTCTGNAMRWAPSVPILRFGREANDVD
jgi:hypothetical protein